MPDRAHLVITSDPFVFVQTTADRWSDLAAHETSEQLLADLRTLTEERCEWLSWLRARARVRDLLPKEEPGAR